MDLWDGLIGGVSGGVIGAVGSYLAIRAQLRAERELRSQESKARVDAMLVAIYYELKYVWSHYNRAFGAVLSATKAGSAFRFIAAMSTNRYPIYEANAGDIGLIEDGKLREMIVVGFTQIKSLMDDYQYNNDLIHEIERIRAAPDYQPFVTGPGNDMTRLIESGDALRESHKMADASVSVLLDRIEKYLPMGMLD